MFNLKDNLTIVVFTKEPFVFGKDFDGYKTINQTQVITKDVHWLQAWCRVIKNIETKFFTVVDDDDPFPVLPIAVPDVGLIFGDNIIEYKNKIQYFKHSKYNIHNHIKNSTYVHKGICRTFESKNILEQVENCNVYPEQWLFTILANDYGYCYDPEFKYTWRRSSNGIHKDANTSMENTRYLLSERYQIAI